MKIEHNAELRKMILISSGVSVTAARADGIYRRLLENTAITE